MKDTLIDLNDILEARRRITPHIYRTPLEPSVHLGGPEQKVFLKLECQQVGRSFKIRGALNRLLQLDEKQRARGVAAVSSGNHGIAVAYGASRLGIRNVQIIVPETTPKSKLEKIQKYGGKAVLMGSNFDEAHQRGIEWILQSGLTLIDGGDEDPAIFAGQGTVALEILAQEPEIDTLLVPIGGGALAVATAIAAKRTKPGIRVIGLYSEACAAWADSIRDNRPHLMYPSGDSVCEAMVGGVSAAAFMMRDWLDEVLPVKEAMIRRAMVHAVLKEQIVAEASGAVSLAAMMQYGPEIAGERIALLVTGGNADSDLLAREIRQQVPVRG